MNRNEKEAFVTSLRADLSDAGIVVVTRQSGLTVSESTDLRHKVHKIGGRYKVAKNTLIRLAIKDTANEALTDHLNGPVALAYSPDPVAAAKITVEFANKNDKLEIVCGMLGDKLLDSNGVKTLAKLPSLDQLRGKLVGLLQAPASKIVGVLQAPGGQVARVLSAYSRKG
ncbi:50S ribosomal protein L10 [Candidatus Nucleicultrix amoebiphila]|uniref:Large ribosomal subunit protein uL10 n=1 Tax=Candidatus Nucleicultrix amoebiphila FS5 TaxID=1414854 RepID=A0A1W6N636_9PROT|nr:50S ribosomal protein L10 [Candidatus Nucleicultrix amoebiphila]ARN85314.1 50S ribosomal protein L10 [Candidatus Nucleicultrix amoebiphila FS5]